MTFQVIFVLSVFNTVTAHAVAKDQNIIDINQLSSAAALFFKTPQGY